MSGVKGRQGITALKQFSALERFIASFHRGPETECWVWQRRLNQEGYGYLWDGVAQQKAHRFSYELHCGPVPEHLNVLHSCDNRACVNPAHLRAGTQRDNVQDAVDRGRWPKGPGSNPWKLDGRAIMTGWGMQMLGFTKRQIADAFEVSPGTIRRALKGQSHVAVVEAELNSDLPPLPGPAMAIPARRYT